MERKDVKAVIDAINSNIITEDWVEDNPDTAFEYIKDLANHCMYLYSRIDCAIEQIEPYHNIVIRLNDENKKMWKQLNSKK